MDDLMPTAFYVKKKITFNPESMVTSVFVLARSLGQIKRDSNK